MKTPKDQNAFTSVRVLKADREELYLLRDELVDIPLEAITSPLSREAAARLAQEPLLSEEAVESLRGAGGQAYSRGDVMGLAIRIARRVVAAVAPPIEAQTQRKGRS